MAEDNQVIRSIDWRGMFPFLGIFRGFRIAIHPSKLILALIALALVYGGGAAMDWVWPAEERAVPDELMQFESSRTGVDQDAYFNALRSAEILEQEKHVKNLLDAIGKPDGTIADLEAKIFRDRDAAVREAEDGYAREKTPAAETMREIEIQGAYQDARAALDELEGQRVGIFTTFRTYELAQINTIARGVREANFIGPEGVTQGLRRFLSVGPAWAIRNHPIFFSIYGLYFLVIWSVFGGAICRIAAVHFARDEKISVRQALAFSTSKFLSFVSAPVIPLAIVVMMGLVLALGGVLTNIPFLGPIVVGALFFCALAAGFVMTLVLLGLAGGFNLMYPTIAVEGSDSFDAISRSFSYLYARPWRLGFYTAVAIAYGALTYLFVRYFIYLLLCIVHVFLGLFVVTRAASLGPLFQTLWPSPASVGRLSYSVDWISLSLGERIGAVLISFWVYLAVYMLGAFTISFYFSVNTIIYYLMRHEVDQTELDDVHLEQTDEEFAEAAGIGGTSVTLEPGSEAVAVVAASAGSEASVTQAAPPATS
jgi:hypothetical protein